jgi:uncharacterized protein YciU (UPF0263 family)
MLGFKQFIFESDSVESFEWSKPLYHGTSLNIAKKILQDNKFVTNLDGGVNEIGSGVYTHPSMNRTSPWVHLTAKQGNGAIIEIHFKKKLNLAIKKRGLNQRSLMDQGFDGMYDKNGDTQVPHQVILFNAKNLNTGVTKLNSDLVDWENTKIIPFDKDKHDYLSGANDPEQKQYYQ